MSEPRSVLGRRIAIGAGLIALALVALVLGGYALWLLTAAMAGGMLIEWGRMFRVKPVRIIAGLAALGLVMALALPIVWGPDRDTVAALSGVALVLAAVGANGTLALGLFYVGLPVLALLFLRDLPTGFAVALWTLAIVWATDIGAFFAGRAVGGPRLAPRISPNKTWAGLIGGMIAAAVIGAGIASATGLGAGFLWAAPLLAIAAQAGDLLESHLKRRAGIKDSGATLGPHGGLLDRLDGAVPVLVIVGALVANGNL